MESDGAEMLSGRRASANALVPAHPSGLGIWVRRMCLMFLTNVIFIYLICFYFPSYYISNEYKGMPGGRNLYK